MVRKKPKKITSQLERLSLWLTNWVGTPQSIIVHTILFIAIFALSFVGYSIDQILLILTTALSLEAIYLAIFIQMTVNRNTKSLEEVEADIDEIQEDVEDLEEDVEDISEDIDEIQEEDNEDEQREKAAAKTLDNITDQLQVLLTEIDELKRKNQDDPIIKPNKPTD